MNQSLAVPRYRQLFSIALPMVVSQASETMMLFVDRLFLSWLGKEYISAAMSGGLSFFVFASLFAGTVGYVNSLTAQYFGANDKKNCIRTITQGIYLSLLFYPIILGLIPLLQNFFVLMGHSPVQLVLETSYFRILMAGGILMLLRNVLVGFFLGIGKTRIVMLANIIGMLINIPFNYILIFGKLGFPALGMEGAAFGSVGGSFIIFLILLIAYLRHKLYRENHHEGWAIRLNLMKKILKYGMPAGVEIFLNVFAFNLFIQLMHSYSADVAAAVTITFNYDMLAFIPMLGMGFAISSLVGQQMGAENPQGARKVTFMALRIAMVYAGSMMVLFIFGAGGLVKVFSGGFDVNDAAILPLAETMLRMASIYLLADVVQIVFAGALRGAGDTRWVMITSGIIHWAMAGLSFYLIRIRQAPPLGVWVMFICFILTMGTVMLLRFIQGKWMTLRIIHEDSTA
ncbi:MAG: MATE family efflux transporter [Spirochaetaceae bacterium]|jgi:MATE family multidrug resistance protein|nr:MATE family efflux transporter [Spirochaetaceae bacterium]